MAVNPATSRRLTALPIEEGLLDARRVLLTDQVGATEPSSQSTLQDIVGAGLRLLGLPNQAQQIDPITDLPITPDPLTPDAVLGPRSELPFLSTDALIVVRRGAPNEANPYAEMVNPYGLTTVLPRATPNSAGLMSGADKSNLDLLVNGGGNSVLRNTIPLGAALVGPTSHALIVDDAGLMIPVDASAGDVTINIASGIVTPANNVFAGCFNKKGTGNLIINTAGAPGTRPSVADTAFFSDSVNLNGTTMVPRTNTHNLTVSGDRQKCAIYVMLAATPNNTGWTSGTMGLTIGGTPKTWDKTSKSASNPANIAPSGWFAAKWLGDVTNGQVIPLTLAVSAGWFSYAMTVVLVDNVEQTELFIAGTAECATVQTGATGQTLDLVVAGANQTVFYASFCRSSGSGAALQSVTGATALETANSGNGDAAVTTNTKALMAYEDAAVGTNAAVFTFPTSVTYVGICFAVRPPNASGMTLIMPGNGSNILTGVNQVYGWLYDNNALTFQMV